MKFLLYYAADSMEFKNFPKDVHIWANTVAHYQFATVHFWIN